MGKREVANASQAAACWACLVIYRFYSVSVTGCTVGSLRELFLSGIIVSLRLGCQGGTDFAGKC